MPPSEPDALAGFSEPTRAWFTGAFEAPTPAQAGAWAAIGAGQHALVVAPTGSGKTLAAFLWALDGLMKEPHPADPAERCRVLYVSPLKALASDVERNLRSPLVGIRQAATRLGLPVPDVTVGVRTGDTPPAERRTFATRPPDVLITTPESLFLILTSGARAGLAGVRTVILDEIHAVAGSKRGAHLAVSLERLDALLESPGDLDGRPGHGPAQRVGLSATVRPVESVARFLGGARTPQAGGRSVAIVQPASTKQIEVSVVVPVPDLADLRSASERAAPPGDGATPARRAGRGARRDGRGPGSDDLAGQAAAGPSRPSIWPHVEERVVDLVSTHRSTLVFTNSRRGAERLTSRMNEVWAERNGEEVPDHGALRPSEISAQSGASVGIDTADPAMILARAHHGSMSRAERTRTESELKAGRLPAVVATSSLELGIDMGAIDLVVQVGSPPSVASGLQRIGRAGHQVGAVSRGVVFPTYRGELIPAAVVAMRMRAGLIEHLKVPSNPLDVLAQQVVAMVAVQDWDVEALRTVVRRSAPFTGLGDATFDAVLDMLAGRYPSEEFAELRPRIVWDRTAGILSGRPGALRLAVTSGGTIPDRGLYGVFLATGSDDSTPADPVLGTAAARHRGGKRVGELDEEMVYESRVGDTFTLGSSTWRIEDITPDRVLVTPAPGVPGRLPFWKGDSPGRPAELGRALGGWVRELSRATGDEARSAARDAGLDEWAADNLASYLAEQKAATGHVPDDRTIVVERFRDEIGDWRVMVHSPYGARVHAPWALVLAARLRERYGLDAAALHSDDGIVLRLPDMVSAGSATWDTAGARWVEPEEGPGIELSDLLIEPDEVGAAVRAELGSSVLFGARFREAAARALLLPRRRPDKRQPLWQQRQRSAQLLAVAARYPQFPILLEAARECLQDDFDVAALTELMREIATRSVRVVEVTTTAPSPFAQSLLFGYTAQFLYDGDAPLAERRAAALTLDPTLLAELLGQGGASQLADLLDPDAVVRTEAELSGRAPDRLARHREDVADVVRRHGPLTLQGVQERTRDDVRDEVPTWLDELEARRRLIRVRLAPGPAGPTGQATADTGAHWAAVEDAGRLRDALGVALPVGVPEVFTEIVPDPLGDLVRRHARTHGPFTAADVAARFGIGVAVVTEVLRRLESSGALACGRLRPDVLGGTGEDYCDTEVLRTLRRRSLAALRAEVEPVSQQALGIFLPRWQGVVEQLDEVAPASSAPGARRAPPPGRADGVERLARVVEQLAGAVIPASALETLVLPARLPDYDPRMLDELTASGEVLWAGHAPLAARDGLVSLHPAATADLTLPVLLGEADDAATTPLHSAVLHAMAGGGAFFLDALSSRVRDLLAPGPTEEVGRGGRATGGLPGPVDATPGPAGLVSAAQVLETLWDLVWAGLVTNDGFAVVRARLGGSGPGRTSRSTGGTAHPVRRSAPRGRSLGGLALRPGGHRTGLVGGRPDAGGRWSMLPERETDPTVRAHASAAQLLDRHGILTRAVAPSEGLAGQFGAVYRVLSALEQGGQVRRGYFVEHLGGSQFALPAAVDRVRDDARASLGADGAPRADRVAHDAAEGASGPRDGSAATALPTVVLASTDPANPYGAALAWPEVVPGPAPGGTPGTRSDGRAPSVPTGHRPGRKAGSIVVLVGGALALYVERGGRTVLSFTDDPSVLASGAAALAATATTGRLGRLTVTRINGADVLDRGALETPVARALHHAGFGTTPRGLRLSDRSQRT